MRYSDVSIGDLFREPEQETIVVAALPAPIHPQMKLSYADAHMTIKTPGNPNVFGYADISVEDLFRESEQEKLPSTHNIISPSSFLLPSQLK